jgi:hypothetical protein
MWAAIALAPKRCLAESALLGLGVVEPGAVLPAEDWRSLPEYQEKQQEGYF